MICLRPGSSHSHALTTSPACTGGWPATFCRCYPQTGGRTRRASSSPKCTGNESTPARLMPSWASRFGISADRVKSVARPLADYSQAKRAGRRQRREGAKRPCTGFRYGEVHQRFTGSSVNERPAKCGPFRVQPARLLPPATVEEVSLGTIEKTEKIVRGVWGAMEPKTNVRLS